MSPAAPRRVRDPCEISDAFRWTSKSYSTFGESPLKEMSKEMAYTPPTRGVKVPFVVERETSAEASSFRYETQVV